MVKLQSPIEQGHLF